MRIVRLIGFAIGVVLAAYVLLSYPHEENQVRSWIKKAWAILVDIQQGFPARFSGFLHQMLSAVSSVLSRLYGERLFSWKALAMSASLCLIAPFALLSANDSGWLILFPMVIAIVVAARYRWLHHLIYAGAALIAIALAIEIYKTVTEGDGSGTENIGASIVHGMFISIFISVPFAVLPAVFVDYLSIALVRWSFLMGKGAATLGKQLLWLAAATLAAPCMIGTFVGAAWLSRSFLDSIQSGSREVSVMLLICNLTAAVTSSSFLLVLTFFIFGKAVLAFVPRLVYSLVKVDIEAHRRFTFATGLALVGLCSEHGTKLLEKYVGPLFG